MKLHHTNGHAALQVVPPQPSRLLNVHIDLGRPAGILAGQRRPGRGEAKPAPSAPTPAPAPAPTAPGAPAGTRKQRPPASRPVARQKAPVAPHSPEVATTRGQSGRKASGGQQGRPSHTKPAGGEGTKKARVLGLLRRAQGATMVELREATGWQSHSVRGFLSGAITKKMGLKVRSGKRADGVRVYSVRS